MPTPSKSRRSAKASQPRTFKSADEFRLLDDFLGDVFDAVQAGELTRETFIAGMQHVMVDLDIRNREQALQWLKFGLEAFEDLTR